MNVAKSKVMRSAREGMFGEMNIMIDDEVLEEVAVIKYLGSLVTAVGGVETDVQQGVLEGSKVLGAVRRVLKSRTMSWGVKKTLYRQVIVPMVTYGAETWGLREAERCRFNVFEMKCLRPMVGVMRWGTIRKSEGGRV